MAAALAHLLLPLALLTLEDRNEVRLRSSSDPSWRTDLYNRPSLSLSLNDARSAASINYAPSFTLLSVGNADQSFLVFNSLSVSFGYRFKRATFFVSESGEIGNQNLRLVLGPVAAPPAPVDIPGAPPPVGPTPPNQAYDQVVYYGATTTTLGSSQILSKKLTLDESVGFSARAGLDDESATLYPQQLRWTASAGLGVTVTPIDTLRTGVQGTRARTGQIDADLAAVTEQWSRRLSADMALSISGGVAYTRSREVVSGYDVHTIVPIGSASIAGSVKRHEAETFLNATLDFRPTVDQLTGIADFRVFGSAGVGQIYEHLSWRSAALGGSSTNRASPAAVTTIGGLLGLAYRFNETVALDGSVTSTWQEFQGATTSPFLWVGRVALVFSPSAWKL